ncbi:MAG TPA: aminotransferase class III-fold pyridoxal phosphate-dependent enzyme [Candidatus Acidoferrum sp.]|jgi:adenosylmethionine-8-amino-7-oxononanoate aminotransferase|nr:aminotransferase class III-fold pyridoxal phosphate-dependent enzyme [Candidatus Acidoferrum sp.]
MIQAVSHLWLPFTQMQSFDASTRTFVRGDGTSLHDARGRRVFDAVSSIWTIIHGHSHPAIVDAIALQAATLDHATTLGATNLPAEALAHALCELAETDYAFFAGDGASAVEAAIKMALHYWQHAGEPQRTRFLRLVDAYHGDTAGAMSLSDIAVFKSRYGAVTFETRTYECVDDLEAPDVAAVIVEPIVQAAAGMRLVPPDRYLPLRTCTPLVIVDEIATGFGRTGTMFAFEQLGLRPDLICLGKGISGGVLALSAVLARERIYHAFLGSPEERKQFFHGHSYAGNPIACAAALASLELFALEGTFERAGSIERIAAERLETLRDHPDVRETRQAGTMIGIELHEAQRAWPMADVLYELGHFTRPIGATVQLVPPLSSSDAVIHDFFDAFSAALERTR